MVQDKKRLFSKKEQESFEKINSLQEMIATAEQTITSAKQMLAQIQRNSGANDTEINSDSRVIHGTFDGQIMIGEDDKQYPVPANYASKSKLVESDMLKLTITKEGSFMYKQIGPAERKFLIGIAKQDERGNFVIQTENKIYKVLLAAVTYFKIELGDEVTIVVPRDQESIWGAIENITKKASDIHLDHERPRTKKLEISHLNDGQEISEQPIQEMRKRPTAIEKLEREIEEERKQQSDKKSIVDEWIPDIEELKKEAGHPVGAKAEEE